MVRAVPLVATLALVGTIVAVALTVQHLRYRPHTVKDIHSLKSLDGSFTDTVPSENATFVPSSKATRVKIAHGTVEGKLSPNGNVRLFVGLPFAEPPVGTLRWLPPQPVRSWTGVYSATQNAPACTQEPHDPVGDPYGFKYPLFSSEDCLYMTVATPTTSDPTGRGKAVMVYIHGGTDIWGSGLMPLSNATGWVESSDFILVNFNYRLGLFGQYFHPEAGAFGNQGYLDQLAVLRWVRQNIAAFGGDPRQVTIFGQSSGAYAVAVHGATPFSYGLAKYGIAESPNNNRMVNIPRAYQTGNWTRQFLNCSYCFWPFCNPLQCMQSRSTLEVATAEYTFTPTADMIATGQWSIWDTELCWYPIHELLLLPVDIVSVQQRLPNYEAYFTGNVANEALAELHTELPEEPPSLELYAYILGLFFGAEAVPSLMELYPLIMTADLQDSLQAPFMDYVYACSSRFAAQNTKTPTYYYYYTHVNSWLQFNSIPSCQTASCHACELEALFGTVGTAIPPRVYTPEELTMVADMQGAWVSFAKTGVPTLSTGKLNVYKQNNEVMVIDAPHAVITPQYERPTCAFWNAAGIWTVASGVPMTDVKQTQYKEVNWSS